MKNSEDQVKTKIFGIGLNKTGTTTLGHILKSFNFNHLSARKDLLIKFRNGDLEGCFREIDKFDSFEDWPYPLMYKELFKRYHNSKFILTVRKDKHTWLKSLTYHSLNISPFQHCRKYAYGFNYPIGFEKEHLEIYETHNREVKNFFKKMNAEKRLLEICWEKGDDLKKLSDFLNLEPHISITKIPHLNKMTHKKVTPTKIMNHLLSFYYRCMKRIQK